jgi:hypothetical protein
MMAALALLAQVTSVPAALTGRESSEQFFATVADRLLRQQFGFASTNIPIAPTNAYTPGVHRLLQVTANLHDVTRTNLFPSVFRPLFTSNAAGVSITCYTNDNQRSTLDAWLTANRRYGIPLVIGARKGFPSFNEYTLQTDIRITRQLQFVRPTTYTPPTQTNQAYILGISNLIAAEVWNSYQAPYPRPLAIEIGNTTTVRLTNQAGLNLTLPMTFAVTATNIPPGGWKGKQFLLPVYAQTNILEPSAYQSATRSFVPLGPDNIFEPGFPTPDWHLSLSNQFVYVLTDDRKIVDFVLSTDFKSDLAIGAVLMNPHQQLGPNGAVESSVIAQLWNTNRVGGSIDLLAPTLGVHRQISVCLGSIPVSDELWADYRNGGELGQDKNKAIQLCQLFFGFGMTEPPPGLGANDSLTLVAPLSPVRRMVRTVTWQANDPLVHSHPGDLSVEPHSLDEFFVPPSLQFPAGTSLASLGQTNARCAPWGGNPAANPDRLQPVDPLAYDLAVKDPGFVGSDDWDFPEGQPLAMSWLGRVHRGTPWQTLYLKSKTATAEQWAQLSSDPSTHPTNDWSLVSVLASLLNTNAPQQLVSVNEPGSTAWAAAFDGVTVLTNVLADGDLLAGSPPELVMMTMMSNSPQAALLIQGVGQARAGRPSHRFSSLADLFAVPDLTLSSPWLNLGPVQERFGLSDSALEAIPAQIVSRLRAEDIECALSCQGGVVTVELRVPWTGLGCELQTSTNLRDWTTQSGPFIPSNGVVRIELPAPADTAVFYRGKLAP